MICLKSRDLICQILLARCVERRVAISSFVSFPPSPSPTTTHPPLLRPREDLAHLGSAIDLHVLAECWRVAVELLAGVGSLMDFG